MRHYYDDPWAAGYMWQNYKMEFVDEKGWAIPRREILADIVNGEERRYYVHEDSLHLLEPRDGDKDKNGFCYHANLKWWLWSGQDSKGHAHVFNAGCRSKTATRGGKAFHMPLTENEINQGKETA
jgi:hypothetical protein